MKKILNDVYMNLEKILKLRKFCSQACIKRENEIEVLDDIS